MDFVTLCWSNFCNDVCAAVILQHVRPSLSFLGKTPIHLIFACVLLSIGSIWKHFVRCLAMHMFYLQPSVYTCKDCSKYFTDVGDAVRHYYSEHQQVLGNLKHHSRCNNVEHVTHLDFW